MVVSALSALPGGTANNIMSLQHTCFWNNEILTPIQKVIWGYVTHHVTLLTLSI